MTPLAGSCDVRWHDLYKRSHQHCTGCQLFYKTSVGNDISQCVNMISIHVIFACDCDCNKSLTLNQEKNGMWFLILIWLVQMHIYIKKYILSKEVSVHKFKCMYTRLPNFPIESQTLRMTCWWTVCINYCQFTLCTGIYKRTTVQSVVSCLDGGVYWFLCCLLISLRITSILVSSSAVIVLSSNGLPVTQHHCVIFCY